MISAADVTATARRLFLKWYLGPTREEERAGYLRKEHLNVVFAPISALKRVLRNLQQSLGARQKV